MSITNYDFAPIKGSAWNLLKGYTQCMISLPTSFPKDVFASMSSAISNSSFSLNKAFISIIIYHLS